jgi:acyl-CoA thioesterase-2
MASTLAGMALPQEAVQQMTAYWRSICGSIQQEDDVTFTVAGFGDRGIPGPRIGGPPMIFTSMLALSRSLDVSMLHSLKAEFLRLGDPSQPLRYEIEHLRNTRNFITRRVTVRQEGVPCACLTLSFTQQWDDGFRHQLISAPSFGAAESLPEMWEVTGMLSRPILAPIEGRLDLDRTRPAQRVYQRIADGVQLPLHEVAALRAALTDGPSALTALFHYGLPPGSQASLDHQVWFHRPITWDGWHLVDLWSDVAIANRAIVHGRVWDEAGGLLATLIQEVSYQRAEPPAATPAGADARTA